MPTLKVKRRKTAVILGSTLIVVFLVRLILPTVVERFVNARLSESEDYNGSVGDVDISLITGSYSVDDVEITKRDGDIPVPLLSAGSIQFSLLWSALFRGEVVAEIDFYETSLNIVDSDREPKKQTGAQLGWLSILNDLLPLRIERTTVHGGEFHFRNFDTNPPIDVYVSGLELEAVNLTNSRDLSDSLVASIDLEGKVVEGAQLTAKVALDPFAPLPTFDADMKLVNLQLNSIDTFISYYAPFDVEGGQLDLVVELASSEGRIVGYAKPLIEGLDVFEWRADFIEDKDNPFLATWEALLDFGSEIFENNRSDRLAATIPIEGRLDNPDVEVLSAIGSIFENAFIRAYRARFSNDVSLDFDSNIDEVLE